MPIGTTIADILNTWADFGIFAYVLPFLMIFAVVFGIFTKIKVLGDNKGVNATIALAVGLMALQFDYVANFFATIFPYAGMGLSVLLLALIFMGLVMNTDEKKLNWVWFAIGLVIFVVVLMYSLSDYSWFGGYAGADYWPAILAAIIILGALGWIVFDKGPGSTATSTKKSPGSNGVH